MCLYKFSCSPTDGQLAAAVQGELDFQHHRKRDGFTLFAEAAAKSAHLQRRGGEAH
jgi:hypothetical protein